MSSRYLYRHLGVLLSALGVAACGSSNEPAPVAPTGTLRISTTTSGTDPDPDGYALLIDTLAPIPIAANVADQAVTVRPGTYQVLLDGIAANCQLAVPAPVEVTAGATVDVSLAVGCTPILANVRVVVQSTGQDPDPGGYRVLADGAVRGVAPPNGEAILLVARGHRTITLDEIASNCSLTSAAAVEVDVSESTTAVAAFTLNCVHTPKIAFAQTSGVFHIFTMNPDGSGFSQVTPPSLNALYPEWSPDGNRLTFVSTERELYLVNADGTNPRRLAPDISGIQRAAWSPDGSQLAVSRQLAPGTVSLFVFDTSGTMVRQITSGPTLDLDPSWSPDGSRIAFSRDSSSFRHIFVARADGSAVTQITTDDDDRGPVWSPDGSRLVFTGQGPTGERRPYLANADGTNRVPLQPLQDRIWAYDVRWVGNGSTVIASDSERMFTVDVATGQELSSLPVPGGAAFLAWRN